jgi:hypothetical protein
VCQRGAPKSECQRCERHIRTGQSPSSGRARHSQALVGRFRRKSNRSTCCSGDAFTGELRALRGHRRGILNWFGATAQISAGTVEGLKNTGELTARTLYGFRTAKVGKLALFTASAASQSQIPSTVSAGALEKGIAR